MANPAISIPSPAAPPLASGRAVPAEVAPKPATRGFQLLVVDDDAAIREVASGLLEDAGYAVATAEDGLEALAFLGRNPPDLVITDLRMPRMSGFELLKIMRERFPQVPVVAVSGEFTGDALPPGVLADVFFSKDCYATPRFTATIEELLAVAPIRTAPPRKRAPLSRDVIYGDADIRAVLGRLADERLLPAADLGQSPLAQDRWRTRPSAFATSGD